MLTETLLIELGTEELPPKALKNLATIFHDQIKAQLIAADLTFEHSQWFATPRRLAVKVTALSEKQADKEIEKRGPAINVAFDAAGNASKAAIGWAHSNGITVEQAERLKTDKGEWLLHRTKQQGKTVAELIPLMVNEAVNKLPIPKPMRWGSSSTQFIRPVHTLTLLFGAEVIAGECLGVVANNLVTGHRFHHQGMVTISHADEYETKLEQAFVIVDYQQRQNMIIEQIKHMATSIGGKTHLDEELLEEVTSIVEWPVVMAGSFDEAFLDVPPEPLIYSMKDHQKYFPVVDQNNKLLNKFIFVANVQSKEPEQVISGNEKVIRPRLADAEFFFKTDKLKTLESRLATLETVLFQQQLGTLKEKSVRIAQLSEYIAKNIGENPSAAYRAGLLSKTDLLTDMVQEFPQVQGTMGKYYAQHDGEQEEVAQALEDQYRPRFSGDSLPQANLGCAVAIADKIDTLVGIFGINQQPKGDRDPFALRRAAIGLIRIIIEKQLNLDVQELITKSIELYGEKLKNSETLEQVIEFVQSRYRAYYQEKQVSVDIINAVLFKAPTSPLDFDKRINAVSHFKTLPQAQTLAAANKRVGNILSKMDISLFNEVRAELITEKAELDLFEAYQVIKLKVEPLLETKNYQTALSELTKLKDPIDNFFDNVMVMADDELIKTNRLTLLNAIRNSFLNIADISVL